MSFSHRKSVYATKSMAAFLTQKQADVLTALADGPHSTRDLSEFAEHIIAFDIEEFGRQSYLSSTETSMHGCSMALVRRGLVTRVTAKDGTRMWALTVEGRRAFKGLIP